MSAPVKARLAEIELMVSGAADALHTLLQGRGLYAATPQIGEIVDCKLELERISEELRLIAERAT